MAFEEEKEVKRRMVPPAKAKVYGQKTLNS